jgi:alkane 1-monooxygenase
MYQTWTKAWSLEFERLRRENKFRFHPSNEMLQFQVVQLLYLVIIYLFFGGSGFTALLLSGLTGAILLETINYIEHYGLLRKKEANGYYERVQTKHSWNSDHLIGRLLLFELSRHSDHHYKSHKKYQELQSANDAPQMPTGYPGMMVLSIIAPLWFWIMNRRVSQFNS